MGQLIVVTGPPGAGKSTVARLVAELFEPSALVPGDEFFAFVARGYIAPWNAGAHRQNAVVIEAAAAAAGRLAVGGYSVVHDGVIGPWFLDDFVEATRLPSVQYVVLLPTEQICVERVALRTGHGFTDLDATRHMYREFVGSSIETRHVITARHSAEMTAAKIFDLVLNGSLVRTAKDDRGST